MRNKGDTSTHERNLGQFAEKTREIIVTNTVTLYGIKACDTCRKARKSIEKTGKSVNFVDIRETPLTKDEWQRLLAEFGGDLLNRKSTTWRGLSEDEREDAPLTLLQKHPTLMKRPVIEGQELTLGWNAAAQAVHLG